MMLIGRDVQRKHIAELVDGAGDRGDALLVIGEAGIGESTLLGDAAASGLRVLRTTGCEPEQHLPFAGLHQLLYPVQDGIDALAGPHRGALATALGLAGGAPPTVYLVGLATLNLLADATEDGPLLLLVDDAQWLDRSSAEVLSFVARRLESEHIVLVAALRDGSRSLLAAAGLASMALDRLPDDVAGELLDAVAPDLTPAVRSRLLREAAGNPLALTELPLTARQLHDTDPIVPLTDRLARAFTARVAGLPTATRACLLIAALNDSDSLAETLTAASADVATLTLAMRAGLVEPCQGAVRFRHPLLRSAIVAAADPGERRDAHRALATTLHGLPDRRVWHLAAATDGPDEAVAAGLAAAADRAARRGGVHAAIAAWERAARLSEVPDRKVERLLRAAELGRFAKMHAVAVGVHHRDAVPRYDGNHPSLPGMMTP
jgi:hypothetical protein